MVKEKDILKKLKAEATRLEPNLSVFLQSKFPKKKPAFGWSFIPLATMVTSVVIIAIMINAATPITPSSSISEGSHTSVTTSTSIENSNSMISLPPLKLNSDQEAISIASITTATLFNQTNWNQFNSSPAVRPIQLRGNRPQLNFTDTMALLKPYLGLFEQLTGVSAAPIVLEAPSDRVEFTTMHTFDTLDIQGQRIAYKLYFNLTEVETIEEETYYSLNGELTVNNGNPLLVIGSKTIEEDKITIRFRASFDTANFISTRYQVDGDETKIFIQQSLDGVLSSSSFNLEVEDDEVVVDLFFFENNNGNVIRDRFQFEREVKNGQLILEIKYNVRVDGEQIRGKITVIIIELFDEFDNLTGYAYQAFQYNEDGEKEGEWQDDRKQPHGEREHDHDEDDDREDDHDEEDDDEDDDDEDDEIND
jgi:hypothetical protein